MAFPGSFQPDIYITLVSNGTSLNSDNTCSLFTNTLANPIHVPRALGWRICLHSISCQNALQQNHKVKYMVVLCDQIKPCFANTQILSLHARSEYNVSKERVHYYESDSYVFHELNTDEVQNITIRLADNLGNLIVFATGQPTIVTLVLRKMSKLTEFVGHISCQPTDLYPDNTADAFTVDFTDTNYTGEEDEFRCDWEVALGSITYQPTFSRVQTKQTKRYMRLTLTSAPGHAYARPISGQVPVFSNVTDSLSTAEAYIDFLTLCISKMIQDDDRMPKKIFDFRFINGTTKIVVKNYLTKWTVSMTMPYNFAYTLGDRSLVPDVYGNVTFTLDPQQLARMDKGIDLNALNPDSMMLYTSFTKPTYVANVIAPVIRIIPVVVNDGSTAYLTFNPKHLLFHHVNVSSLKAVKFELRQTDGKKVCFKDKNQRLNMTLIFRKKRRA